MIAHVFLASSLLALATAQSCRNSYNGYCCNGSIITSDGSDDISKLVCCQGDPIDNSINLGDASTCTAGSAVPLTQVSTMSNGMIGGTETGGIIIGGSSTSLGSASASATAETMTSAMSAATSTTRSMGSGATSSAAAAATSTAAGVPTASNPLRSDATFTLFVGWLLAALY